MTGPAGLLPGSARRHLVPRRGGVWEAAMEAGERPPRWDGAVGVGLWAGERPPVVRPRGELRASVGLCSELFLGRGGHGRSRAAPAGLRGSLLVRPPPACPGAALLAPGEASVALALSDAVGRDSRRTKKPATPKL